MRQKTRQFRVQGYEQKKKKHYYKLKCGHYTKKNTTCLFCAVERLTGLKVLPSLITIPLLHPPISPGEFCNCPITLKAMKYVTNKMFFFLFLLR